MPLDSNGSPLHAGEPEYTDDDRLWDGARFYRLVEADVRKRQGVLLGEAEVVVLVATDCCEGIGQCGTKRLADEKARRRLVTAGFVRFAGQSGSLQRWHADDGAVLALLLGTVVRPTLD